MEITARDIESTLESLLNVIARQEGETLTTIEHLPQIQAATQCIKNGDPKGFYFALQYGVKQMEGRLLADHGLSSDARFLFQEGNFIRSHIRRLIEDHEGSSCCGDKTSYMMSCILKSLKTNEEIRHDREQKYTFHIPTRVFQNHASTMAFFKSLISLHMGRPDSYLIARAEVVKDAQKHPEK